MEHLSHSTQHIRDLESKLEAAAERERHISLASNSSSAGDRKTVVLKVGTSSLVNPDFGIRIGALAQIMEAVAALALANHNVLIVSSGAVGTGAHEMKISQKPTTIARKQALAAIGQVRLMREFNSMLSTLGVESAQVLLTYENLGERSQCINAHNTLAELFHLRVVPVVNENDTVATEALRFGDNDRLSAMVASLINADYLFLLTDVDGVYKSNPKTDPSAERIDIVTNPEILRDQISTGGNTAGSEFGTGGMESKLQAAQIACRAGIRTIIMSSANVKMIPPYVEACLLHDMPPVSFGTVFVSAALPLKGRERWIQSLPPRGKIIVTKYAGETLFFVKSLFSQEVVSFTGSFGILDPVCVCAENDPNKVLAFGLSNYSVAQLETTLLKKMAENGGHIEEDEFQRTKAVIDRGNMVVQINEYHDTIKFV